MTCEGVRVAKIQVLDGERQTLLLDVIMHQFGLIAFDWSRGIVRLGNSRVTISSKATGGSPLQRAKTVRQVLSGDQASNVNKQVMNPRLTPSQMRKLSGLVEVYQCIFDEKSGRTDTCEHVINTGDSLPVKSRPRRLPPRWEEEINEQLSELLQQGLCKPSSSPWASNVVLVTKKDGRQRFAVDYRKLNEVTKKDAYSIPQIQFILDKIHGFRFLRRTLWWNQTPVQVVSPQCCLRQTNRQGASSRLTTFHHL